MEFTFTVNPDEYPDVYKHIVAMPPAQLGALLRILLNDHLEAQLEGELFMTGRPFGKHAEHVEAKAEAEGAP